MKNIVRELALHMKSVNRLSKEIIRYGTLIIVTLMFTALLFYFFRGRIAGYYECVEIYTSLLECIKDCFAAVYIPALIIEILNLAEKSGADNE